MNKGFGLRVQPSLKGAAGPLQTGNIDLSKNQLSGESLPRNTSAANGKSPLHALVSAATDAWIQSQRSNLSEADSNHSASTGPQNETGRSESARSRSHRLNLPPGKSALHAMFFNATDAWLQAQRSMVSFGGSSHTASTSMGSSDSTKVCDPVTGSEKSCKTSEVKNDEAVSNIATKQGAPCGESLDATVSVPEQHTNAPQQGVGTPVEADIPNIQEVSSTTMPTEMHEDEDNDMDSTSTSSSSYDSDEDSMHSEISSLGSMDSGIGSVPRPYEESQGQKTVRIVATNEAHTEVSSTKRQASSRVSDSSDHQHSCIHSITDEPSNVPDICRQADACTVIQAWSRRTVAVAAFAEKKNAVCTIQSFVRVSLARELLTRNRHAAIVIESWIRGRQSSLLLKAMRRETDLLRFKSAVTVQSTARMWLAKREFQRTIVQIRAATLIAAWIRRFQSISILEGLKREKDQAILESTIKIQSIARACLARRNYRRAVTGAQAATSIAAWYRGRQAASMLKTMKQEKQMPILRSVVSIQATGRAWLARVRFHRSSQAATRIAAWTRRCRCVAQLKVLKKEKQLFSASAVKIQSAVRSWAARRGYKRTLDSMAMMCKENEKHECSVQSREVAATPERGNKVEAITPPMNGGTDEAQAIALRMVTDELAKLQAEFSVVQAQKNNLEEEKNGLEAEKNNFEAEKNSLKKNFEAEKNSLKKKLAAASTQTMGLQEQNATLREQNHKLEQSLRKTEVERSSIAGQRDQEAEEARKKLNERDETIANQNLRIKKLTELNDSATKEASKYRAEVEELKRQHKAEVMLAASKLSSAEQELERATRSREQDDKLLEKELKAKEKLEEQKRGLEQKIASLKKEHAKDIEALTEELRRTHDSHQVYLTEMMSALEQAHGMHVEETKNLRKQIEDGKKEKEKELKTLKEEVRLLRLRKRGIHRIKSAIDVEPMKGDLAEESESRARRSAEFDDIVQSLNSLVAESNALPADIDECDMKQVVEQQERAQKMSELIDMLNDIYKTEEDSQDGKNQTALEMIEEFVAVSEPDRYIKELRERLAEVEFSAAKLREELKDKEVCKRCEIRNAAARRRIQRQ